MHGYLPRDGTAQRHVAAGTSTLAVLAMNPRFWSGRKVFLTGHTGFKGGWLALWLARRGANVHGYALDSPTTFNFFQACDIRSRIHSSTIADIRDLASLQSIAHF